MLLSLYQKKQVNKLSKNVYYIRKRIDPRYCFIAIECLAVENEIFFH